MVVTLTLLLYVLTIIGVTVIWSLFVVVLLPFLPVETGKRWVKEDKQSDLTLDLVIIADMHNNSDFYTVSSN
ncbi:MAG: hypothetical protein WA667_09050 [Candidatus Nitrosopolaris sp.]